MIDDSVKNISILTNSKYKIKSRDGVYRNFEGLISGESSDIWEWNGMECTGDHTVGIGKDAGQVRNFENAAPLVKTIEVFDILEVEDTHDYIAKGPKEGSLEVVNQQCLILDEFAFLGSGKGTTDLAEEFIKSVFPTISSAKNKKNSKIIIISTPNGLNSFYQIWHKAEKGKNDFIPYRIDWKGVPRSTDNETFYNNQVNIIGEAGFRQEYGCIGEEETITVRDEDTGETATITIKEFEQMLLDIENSKIN